MIDVFEVIGKAVKQAVPAADAGAAAGSGQAGVGAGVCAVGRGAGVGARTTTGSHEQSPDLVQGMLDALGPLPTMPRNGEEFAALLSDRSRLRIPVLPSAMQILKAALTSDLLQVFRTVPGSHRAAGKFGDLVCDAPFDVGEEGVAMLAMLCLFNTTFSTLGNNSTAGFWPAIRYNCTERTADSGTTGSRSSTVGIRQRPNMVIIYSSCTLLIGEDKKEGQLTDAVEAIKQYAQGCLPAAHYGGAPGIPAYAASGTTLQFLFIDKAGLVYSAGTKINLATYVGRLQALCGAIQCYRLLMSLAGALAPLRLQRPLWCTMVRDELFQVEVLLKPAGAFKTIRRFKAFAKKHGVTKDTLEAAYRAAAAAAQQQRAQGNLPFLVSAASGPRITASEGFEVVTSPLGYHRDMITEMDGKRVARTCLRAARTLHDAGLVHTDLQEHNVVWLNEEHCMVIDLELCRRSDAPLPKGVPFLAGWDNQTLELRNGCQFFTPTSDLYNIGCMLSPVADVQQWSPLAWQFVQLLLGKQSVDDPGKPLTAEEALRHAWLQVP